VPADLARIPWPLAFRKVDHHLTDEGVAMTRRVSIRMLALVALLGGLIAWPGTASAHEKWFYDATPHQTRWEKAFGFSGILGVGAAVTLTVLAGLAWRARRGRDLIPGPTALGATESGRARFYAIVPLILGIHVGVPLLVLAIKGELFSPNNQLRGPWIYWVGVVQIAVGLSFLYGGMTRLAGVALGVLWLVGSGLFGLEPMLENAHYLGFAAFFALAGRGPYAIDRLLFPALEPSPQLARRALPSLRLGLGLGLAVVAFTEKLANPELSRAFLEKYPLNFTAWIGLPMSDELFVLCAGTTELVIGLCLMFGFFPRTIILTAWVFINMSLTVFDWVELVGHLPMYGVMAVLLIWTPAEEDQRLWVQGVLGTSEGGRTSFNDR
jgi:uncharacterized membrane protein YphA (DoxX/SURF4 family)